MDMPVNTSYANYLTKIRRFWQPLPDKPEETPHSLLSALWHLAAGTRYSAEQALQVALPPLDFQAQQRLRELIELKRSGVPLAHLTERQHFLGLELSVGPGALIPRKETEILGRAVLAKLRVLIAEGRQLRVLDVCTGSGNLALAYAVHEPSTEVYGSDIAIDAIELARFNAALLCLQKRTRFFQGDMFAPFEHGDVKRWDLISCNPPYVSSSKVAQMHREITRHEPGQAFDGGHYGVSCMTRLIGHAPRFLKPASWLAFEVGLGQGRPLVQQLLRNPAFCQVEEHTDDAGNIRAILAKTPPGG